MTEEILINFTPQETRVAVMQQGVVQELHIERTTSRGLVGNVYLGRISRILPGMQSAFVDVGLERTAFLHVADIWQARETAVERPIEKMLAEGQSIVVQVIKDPIGTKGARLSTQISIAGRMLVYLPQEKHIGISQRIEAETEREALRERITRLVPADEPGGFIVRTMAENASDAEFVTDIAYLRKTWSDIRDKARVSGPPTVLYQELSLSQRVLRDFVNPETSKITIDSRENFQKLTAFAEEYTPAVLPLLDHYTGQRPLFDLHGVEEEIQKALARRVDLKSGGYLIMDQTEAMTTVDVNTGGFVGVRNFDDTIFKTNLEAAVTIARQVNGFTALGLVEMTRKRTRESLAHVLCQPCPTCGGRGEVKTARTVTYEILRELLREARQFNAREYRVLAGPAVVDLFLDEESQALALLSDFIGKSVSLQSEPSYSPEQYDIVLM